MTQLQIILHLMKTEGREARRVRGTLGILLRGRTAKCLLARCKVSCYSELRVTES